MTYAFRLRFRTAKHFATVDQSFEIAADKHGPGFTIRATPPGPLRYADWLNVGMAGFATREDAKRHGAQLTERLLLLGVLHSMGFDFGDNQATGSLYNSFHRRELEQESGLRIRDHVHGLDVFEEDPERETRF